MPPVLRAKFKVVGMYCTTCKPIVEKQLKGEQAVKRVDVDLMVDAVAVEYDAALITKEEIKERLERSGYRFVRVADGPPDPPSPRAPPSRSLCRVRRL